MSAPPLPQRTDLTPWANVALPAPDGTRLVLDAHVPPPRRWPVPVVVTRTPYGRSAHLAEGRSWRARGFGYVVADVRGRYDSDGEWAPYRNERSDGAALVDWVCAQPWSDGRVVAYGGSYSGYTAWTMAVERPASVRAVVSLGPSMGLHRTKFEPSGILRLAEHAGWWLERADGRTSRDGLREIVFSEHPDVLAHLPVVDIAARLGAHLPHWADALDAHPGAAPPEAVTDAELSRLDAATLHVGGWYDLLLGETLHLFHRAGAGLPQRPSRELVIGPWGHDLGLGASTRVGDREHGPASVIRVGEQCVRWLRAVLDGAPPRSRAEVFVLGANRWSVHPSWPPPLAPRRCWYPEADGGLLDGGPGDTEPGTVVFTHDPADPYPSALAATDRTGLRARRDVARFTGPPLAAVLRIDGAGHLELSASTTAASADWIVRLLEQPPDGRLLELTHGNATTGPGRSEITVPLDPVAAQLPAGTRLVLEVTGSDFPFLARNLGTGQDRHRGTDIRTAVHTVHTGRTRLLLPASTDDDPGP